MRFLVPSPEACAGTNEVQLGLFPWHNRYHEPGKPSKASGDPADEVSPASGIASEEAVKLKSMSI